MRALRFSHERRTGEGSVIIQPGQTEATCYECRETKPVDNFKLRDINCKNLERRVNYCWTCRSRRNRRRYGMRTGFLYNLKRRYGLSEEQVDAMLIDSSGLCASCGEPFNDMKSEPHVDHCHKTGRVRDLLCTRCNLIAGILEGDVRRFKLILGYLKRHRKEGSNL